LGATTGGQQCASSCLTKAIIKKSFYYPATTDLFNNISYAYPDSQIWITGHSLGGALGALIGMTFGYPTVTFEAPAERMAAVRLHLPLPVKHDNMDALPITHVYHTADPIPNGECVGATSLCANFGFAMESRCHSGKTILYDTVGKLGWSSSITTHRIATLTDDILTEDWDKKVSKASHLTGQEQKSWWSSSWHLPWSKSGEEDKKEEKLGSVPKLRSERKCKGKSKESSDLFNLLSSANLKPSLLFTFSDCSDWTFTDDDDNLTQGV
jgi:lipase ATG15